MCETIQTIPIAQKGSQLYQIPNDPKYTQLTFCKCALFRSDWYYTHYAVEQDWRVEESH